MVSFDEAALKNELKELSSQFLVVNIEGVLQA